jgi:hypothetical protein
MPVKGKHNDKEEAMMGRYGLETKKSAEAVIDAAVAYFGEEGLGLEGDDIGACCATFEGGGGFVRIDVTEGDPTEVELVTREWDHDVKAFMSKIA